jgi:hypothetical protein
MQRTEGAALILALSVLLLLLLLLSGVLSFALARRERIHKEFSRDLAEMEAHSLLLNLKAEMVTQIKRTGGFDMTAWKPGASGTFLSDANEGSSPFFERRIGWTGAPFGAVQPELIGNSTASSATGVLQALVYRPVAGFSFVGLWEPQRPANGNIRAQTAWEVTIPISVAQVSLSAFTFYSAGIQTTVGSIQNSLGRLHSEGDLIVTTPLKAIAPVTAGGTLRARQGGVLLIQKGSPSETRAFSSSSTSEDYQAQGYGWIFERESNPVLMVRPLSTAELFSKTPLGPADKEKQRLKPRCDLRILHSLDFSGKDVFTLEGSGLIGAPNDASKALQRTGNALEFDFSNWLPVGLWPSKVWIETNQPQINAVLIINAQSLRGDLSLATDLDIQVSGSFNTDLPVKKASLMTMGRVVSLP